MVDEIWSESNPDTYFPRLRGYIAQGTGRSLNVPQTKNLQNVAYVRLKNLQLGYNLPTSLISRIKMTQARIYVSAENVWTWSPMYRITHNLDVENNRALGNPAGFRSQSESPGLFAGMEESRFRLRCTFRRRFLLDFAQ